MIIETITVYNIKIIVVVVKVELMEGMVKEVKIKKEDDDKVHFISVKNGQVTNFSCHEINTSDLVKCFYVSLFFLFDILLDK